MYEIDLSHYAKPANRFTSSLGVYAARFYEPAGVRITPELEELAMRAEGLLKGEGFNEHDAHDQVGLHINAAAAAARDCSSQDELTATIISDPEDSSEGTITPNTAVALAPYLPYVSSFEFNLDAWLRGTVAVSDSDWERTKPALRWLELWQDRVEKGTAPFVITKFAEADGANGGDYLAQYVGKLVGHFSDDPAALQYMLGLIPDGLTLPLFSQLGRSYDYVNSKLDTSIGENIIAMSDLVRTVQHVDYYAGDCAWMYGAHNEALHGRKGEEGRGDLVLIYGRDQLIGSIKMIRNRSFLSFVTVEDDGKFPLVRGGVYVPTQELVDEAEHTSEAQGKWAKLAVNSLVVRPLSFIDYGSGSYFKDPLESLPDFDKLRGEAL